jgi:hypothetical protein
LATALCEKTVGRREKIKTQVECGMRRQEEETIGAWTGSMQAAARGGGEAERHLGESGALLGLFSYAALR